MTQERTSGNASREDADTFLTEAIERAKTCDSLTARQRVSVVERLREAVGTLIVSRETLAAWKATLDRAWARVGRAATSALLAATLSLGAGGCGTGGDTSPAPEPTASSASVAPEVREHAESPVPKPDVPKDVAAYFGSEAKARKVYERLATTYMDSAMTADLITTDRADVQPDDFAIRGLMTADTRDRFDGHVRAAATGESDAFQTVTALALYDALDANSGATLNPRVPAAVVQRRVETPRLGIGDDGRAKITLTTRGAVRVVEDGARNLSPYKATATFFVDKSGQVSGWWGEWDAAGAGDEIPDLW